MPPSLTTCHLTGRVALPDNTPLHEARLEFALTRPDWDGALMPPERVSAPLDATGALSVRLWPNGRGQQGSRYRVALSYRHGSAFGAVTSWPLGEITVPEADTADLTALLNLPPAQPIGESILRQVLDARDQVRTDAEQVHQDAQTAADAAAGVHQDAERAVAAAEGALASERVASGAASTASGAAEAATGAAEQTAADRIAVSTDRGVVETARTAVDAASTAATAAAGQTAADRIAVATDRGLVADDRSAAEAAAEAAVKAQGKAETAQVGAQTSAELADGSASSARDAAGAANTSAGNALASAGAAADSATAATGAAEFVGDVHAEIMAGVATEYGCHIYHGTSLPSGVYIAARHVRAAGMLSNYYAELISGAGPYLVTVEVNGNGVASWEVSPEAPVNQGAAEITVAAGDNISLVVSGAPEPGEIIVKMWGVLS